MQVWKIGEAYLQKFMAETNRNAVIKAPVQVLFRGWVGWCL